MSNFRPGRFQILPTVVKNLIIINIIMVVAQFVLVQFGIDLSNYLGLHYWKSPEFKPWQFITHMFMHGSPYDINLTVMHIFGNMFALWMFGSVLENVWGPKRFLIFYLVCGLGAAVLHLGVLGFDLNGLTNDFAQYQQSPSLDSFVGFVREHNVRGINMDAARSLWHADKTAFSQQTIALLAEFNEASLNEATVGASGAVFGILFAFGYLFPNTLLYFYFLIPIKAKYFVAGYAIFELFLGVRNSAGDNVAHFAHLGGMLVAFILLKSWNKNRNRFY